MSHAIPLKRPTAITTEVARLTPSDARRLLDNNTHNRPLTERDVFKWASEMEAGRWQLNGEALKISESNTILDGQHRLEALALQPQGTSIEFLIIRGLPSESQSTMDQGRKRSPSDQLNLAGVEADKSLAAAIRIYLTWADDMLFTDNRAVTAAMTTTRIVDWGQDNPETLDLMRRGLTFRRVKARMGLVAAIYARIAQAEDVDAADLFFQRVQDGLDLSIGSPILALRAKLDSIAGIGKRDRTRLKVNDRDIIGYFITAFNSWSTGKQMAKLQRPQGGTWSKGNFPEIRRSI